MSIKKHLELIESVSSGKELNEAVDTGKAKKEIADKLKELQKVIDSMDDMSEDASALLQAIPSGMKNFMAVQRSLSGAKEKIDAINSSLNNAQQWDKDKLEK